MVFNNYAKYYNLLYKDKDYVRETAYIHKLINRFSIFPVESILDLGCGTGNHAALLSKMGYFIDGVDLSEEMISIAQTKECDKLQFFRGDIASIDLKKEYDVIVSLFHVISYITNSKDLEDVFHNISRHLKKNGILIFDCWYGPAVLTQKPEVRVKRLEDENFAITRIAEPIIYPNENTVDVNYEILIKDMSTKEYEKVYETHKMRYFFRPEIESILKQHQLSLLHCEEWMTGNQIGFETWGVCWVIRKI